MVAKLFIISFIKKFPIENWKLLGFMKPPCPSRLLKFIRVFSCGCSSKETTECNLTLNHLMNVLNFTISYRLPGLKGSNKCPTVTNPSLHSSDGASSTLGRTSSLARHKPATSQSADRSLTRQNNNSTSGV